MSKVNPVWTVGMDLGDKKHAICVLDADGEVSETASPRNRIDSINGFFDRFDEPERVRVVMESGTHSPWLSHLLAERGFEVLVGNARKLRTIWDSDNKNDENDAEIQARIGRFDPKLLYPIRHRSMSAQADLAVIRARDALVRSRSAIINCARSIVKNFGHRLPGCTAGAFPAKCAPAVPPELAPAVDPLLAQVDSLNKQIRKYDQCIERLCTHVYSETALLQQIKGVGPLTALAFILTIEDPHRFKKNRSVGPFLGLTPKRDQSGDTDKALPISKAGDHYLRRLLTQASQYIMGSFGPDCDLRRAGMRIAKKGGKVAKRKAVTAVARKLSVLMLHLWKSGQQYDPFHNQSSTRKPDSEQTA